MSDQNVEVNEDKIVTELGETLQDALDEPRRKKFHDEVAERVVAMTDLLIKDCPELRGLGVIFLWDLDMSAKELPFGAIRGRDMDSPLIRLRLLEQLTKMLQNSTNSIFETLQFADKALIELNGQIEEKRKELDGFTGENTQ